MKSNKVVVNLISFADHYLLIQFAVIYSHTADESKQELELVVSRFEHMMKITSKHELNLIIRDLNAKLDRGKVTDKVG